MIKAGDYYVDLDYIDNNDTVLDLGVGGDYDFSKTIHSYKQIRVIAVDPTVKALRYNDSVNLDYITFINKAVYLTDNSDLILYRNNNPNFVSDSMDMKIKDVGNQTYSVKTVAIKSLIEKYKPSLIKMDIEGAEYDIYEECLGIKQICMETHDYRTDRDKTRDKKLIDFFIRNDYDLLYSNGVSIYTFLLKRQVAQ